MRHLSFNIISLDWISVILYLLLVLLGFMNLYATLYSPDVSFSLDFSNRYTKQLVFIVVSFLMAFLILLIDVEFQESISFYLYLFMLVFMIGVAFFGDQISGAKAWVKVGGISIQPSEFAKVTTTIFLAKFLSIPNVNFKKVKIKLISFMIIFLPVLIIFFQNDAGTALVYFSLILVIYRKGLSGNFMILGFVLFLLFFLTLLFNKLYIMVVLGFIAFFCFWILRKNKKDIIRLLFFLVSFILYIQCVDFVYEQVLEPYQKNRIDVLLGKEIDLQGVGYNTNQSKIAIGSGGFFGKGYLQGTQTKFNFVPEQSTDFIFCTIGEEWGFLGSLITLLLYILLLFRLIYLSERQRSEFSKLYGYGVISIILFHFTINIAMTIGLAPVIGIPLPFLSYGGSSLLGFTILLFVFLKLDSDRLNVLR